MVATLYMVVPCAALIARKLPISTYSVGFVTFAACYMKQSSVLDVTVHEDNCQCQGTDKQMSRRDPTGTYPTSKVASQVGERLEDREREELIRPHDTLADLLRTRRISPHFRVPQLANQSIACTIFFPTKIARNPPNLGILRHASNRRKVFLPIKWA